MSEKTFEVMDVEGGRHIKMWTMGVPVEEEARAPIARALRPCRSSFDTWR
jgi:tRNA-splicing ligase RtcB